MVSKRIYYDSVFQFAVTAMPGSPDQWKVRRTKEPKVLLPLFLDGWRALHFGVV
jgi:hypothetical protein